MVRKVGLTDSVGFACLEDLQLSNSYMWGTASVWTIVAERIV